MHPYTWLVSKTHVFLSLYFLQICELYFRRLSDENNRHEYNNSKKCAPVVTKICGYMLSKSNFKITNWIITKMFTRNNYQLLQCIIKVIIMIVWNVKKNIKIWPNRFLNSQHLSLKNIQGVLKKSLKSVLKYPGDRW